MSVNENILITVIVPFYNAAEHLGQCAESLFAQDFAAVEYIFVDDCSTDCGAKVLEEILTEHPDRKPFVRIYTNSENKGVAYCRQFALNQAQGEYITCCDADDWMDRDMLSSLYEKMSDDTDIVVCEYVEETEGRKKSVRFYSDRFPQLNDIPIDTLHFSLWNKLIRRSLIDNAKAKFFEGIDRWEDLGFFVQLMITEPRTKIIPKPFYHYRRSMKNTLTTASMEAVLADHIHMAKAIEEFLASNPQTAAKFGHFLNYLKFIAKVKYLRRGTFNFRKWKTTIPEANTRIMTYKNIPLPYRIAFLLANWL